MSGIDKTVWKMLDNGLKPKEISAKTGLTITQVYRSSGKYNANKALMKPIETTQDITKYHDDILDIYKKLSLSVGNSITEQDIKKASLSQKTTTMAILTDKIRLIEGKSTENISINLLAKLDKDQLTKLEDLSRSLIKSMLSKEETPKG